MFKKKCSNRDHLYPTKFVYPAVILYTLLFVVPALYGVAMSFTDWNQVRDLSTLQFVGLENFKTVFSPEKNYFAFIKNTFSFTFITGIFKSVMALGAALVLQKGIACKNLHRMALFFPSIISTVVTGIVFKSMLAPNKGFINVLLIAFGLPGNTDWLGNPNTAFGSVMFVDIWRGIGYIMVIYLAGLQSIDTTYYEASSIDGANYWKNLIYITLPLLKQTILINLMLNIIYGLRVFDIIYVLTMGGPGEITNVLYTSVFKEFGRGNYALGSALSTVMLFFLIIFGLIYVRIVQKEEVER